ncbi:flagellar hook-length control protein FliK [Variovorax sp. LjRoot84]|uniref:flagellar hook-length control protein FliK n=1 Tax=Variovorax sp. LjRoot84 TaxID=3342340 RepID=UPI003ED0B04B
MSTFIAPSAGPAAPSQPLTSSGLRGRPADEPQGQRFGEVLERSRAAGTRKSEASPDAAPAEAAALPKPERGADKKDELVSDLLAFALFAPAPVAAQPTAVATPAAGLPSEAKAEVSMATDVAQDPLLAQTPPATALTEADTEAAAKTLPATQDAGPEAKTLPAQAAAAQVDTAKALPVAADASVADAAAPAAVAATPLPPAASALASAKAPAAGTAAQQQAKASPALPSVDETKTVPAAATSTERADAAAAQSPASPTLVPTSTSFMPQAVERASAPAGPTPVLTVAPPVGSDEWGPAIGQQMLRMSTGGHQVAELNLNPAGLGPLKVTLSLGDNQAQAMFVSAHESVRKAVEAALPQLRSTLAEQGISLGQTSVGAESRPWAGQGGGFGQPQQQPSSSRQAAYPGRADTGTDAVAPRMPVAARSTGRAGLDTFA